MLDTLGIEIMNENAGEGGSATVHKARIARRIDERFPEEGTLIAVKEYKPSLLTVPEQVDRIRQEAEIGAQIRHPNVVRVFGAHIPTNHHPCYLFMEWLEGETLDKWGHGLRRNASWERLKRVCEEVLGGVAELHSKDILHRDIKPENIMIVDDSARVMDIGVAEITGDNEHTLHTPLEEFVGSVRYASPQFVLSGEFDTPDDVYSLGATFLELLSGQRPYHEIQRKPVLPISVAQGPPRVGKLRDNVPSSMKILLEGCLHPTRERRPSLDDIRECLQKGGQSKYVQREIRSRATDTGAFKIIKLDEVGGGFYADVGDESPSLHDDYVVVRRDEAVSVPSLNTEVAPEKWIATAELRHVHQSVGYFKLIGRRWVKDERFSRSLSTLLGHGHWEDYDKRSEEPALGDFARLKKSGDD